MVLIILFTMGMFPGKLGAGIGGITAVAAAANISSQDGIGYSGSIAANEVAGTAFTGYQAWPSGFTKGSSAFVGGVYNGENAQDAIVTLQPFADGGQVAVWAQSDVAACVLAGDHYG